MAWKLDTTRIYAEGLDTTVKNIIARLQPINASTILHHFGYEDETVKINGLIVTDTDRDALKAMAQTSTSYVLSGPEGSLGSYFVNDCKVSRTPITCITLYDRPGLDDASPVYQVEMELYIDN